MTDYFIQSAAIRRIRVYRRAIHYSGYASMRNRFFASLRYAQNDGLFHFIPLAMTDTIASLRGGACDDEVICSVAEII